ncbi:hypothetical protein RYD26_12280, partial [Pasteurellaceae bacterium LIM206]|nr:hypothetical protein [Pasteurellaceae bacterium LIM206]
MANVAAAQSLQQANEVISTYGKGGDYQMAIRAVTGVLQGLASGNTGAAIAGGLSPYANLAIKNATTNENGEVNTTANVM